MLLLVVVQQALLVVLKESFKIYKAISEGLINLADRFFDMEYLEAQKGLETYKESLVANDKLQVPNNPLQCLCQIFGVSERLTKVRQVARDELLHLPFCGCQLRSIWFCELLRRVPALGCIVLPQFDMCA